MNNQNQSYFAKWLKFLKDSGKSDEEIKHLVVGFTRLSSLNIYTAIMTTLNEEDIKKIETIEDEEKAEEEMKKLFQKRTGITLEQLASSFREDFAKTGIS